MSAESLESAGDPGDIAGREHDATARAPRTHPLGPLVSSRAMTHPVLGRLAVLGVVAGCAAALTAGALLHPDARGYGTHEQVGLGPCGFPVYVGLPCPSCGMSTAFAYTVRGQWLRAAYAQPMGWLVCVATMAAVPVGLWCFWRGRVIEVNWYRVNAAWMVLVILLLFLAAWAFKIVSGLLDGTWPSG